ncbi:MAG: dTDP-4-dehydrorhamnose reductase [Actinomycetota bacterium]|nr:dTDP-4-dehydrorhamnose reductase [Actinomycetota bacterium]
MRVFITGAGGQVGTDLVVAFADHEVIAATHATLDVGDPLACRRAISAAAPDVIINAAAYTDVDGCESNVERAWRDNATGPGNVGAAAREIGAFLVTLSTDYVFDGVAREPYEAHAPHEPVNVYGETKAAGERAALEANPGATAIVRSAWIYGATGTNFVKTMLRLAGERETLDVVDDQTGSPTWSADLASAIVSLGAARRAGVYHVTNAGSTTWFGFAREIFSLAGLDAERVRPTTSDRFPRPARRPVFSVLSDRTWREAGFSPLRPWRAALAEALQLFR